MSDTSYPDTSSAVNSPTAEGAATPSNAPVGVAANNYRDKKAHKCCEACGATFHRAIYSYRVESNAHFSKRRFCTRLCSLNFHRKKKLIEREANQVKQDQLRIALAERPYEEKPKRSRFYKGNFDL